MFAPPHSSMLPVFSNNHSEVNASPPVPLIACPMQAKHHVTNFFAAFPELFAAFLVVLAQFLRNDLCARWGSNCGQSENYQCSKQSVSFHVRPPPSSKLPWPRWD